MDGDKQNASVVMSENKVDTESRDFASHETRRRSKMPMIVLLVAGIVLILGLGVAVWMVRPAQVEVEETADFDAHIESLNSQLSLMFFGDDYSVNREDYINDLLNEIDNTEDANQRAELVATAANFYLFQERGYSEKDYGIAIYLLNSVDRAEVSLDNNLAILELLVSIYLDLGDVDQAKTMIDEILNLPDGELELESMSVVKQVYAEQLEELNE